jgi:hypothetical protein
MNRDDQVSGPHATTGSSRDSQVPERMKLWRIRFSGIWPVGTAAIVVHGEVGTADGACDLFRRRWHRHYPNCDPEPVTAEELTLEPGDCHILNDGDY